MSANTVEEEIDTKMYAGFLTYFLPHTYHDDVRQLFSKIYILLINLNIHFRSLSIINIKYIFPINHKACIR